MGSLQDALLRRIQDYIDGRYPNWNLDAALRYLPIAEHLNRSRAVQVLDVGSGGVGLSLYWGRKTIALDLSISPSGGGHLASPVLGTAASLPFKDRSIEVIVSSDVIEHIPAAGRTRLLSEMIRVARSQIILAAPCGQLAHQAEVHVAKVYREKVGTDHPWLREHLAHGLPEENEVEDRIRSLAHQEGRRARIQIQKNTNLKLWRWLFRHYFGAGARTSRMMRYYLLALLPLLRQIHWGETYRKIFFVHLEPLPSNERGD